MCLYGWLGFQAKEKVEQVQASGLEQIWKEVLWDETWGRFQ